MNARTAVKLLLGLVLGLPVLMAVTRWVIGLLKAMDDNSAATILWNINKGTSILWLICVVGLVIALAVEAIDKPADE